MDLTLVYLATPWYKKIFLILLLGIQQIFNEKITRDNPFVAVIVLLDYTITPSMFNY